MGCVEKPCHIHFPPTDSAEWRQLNVRTSNTANVELSCQRSNLIAETASGAITRQCRVDAGGQRQYVTLHGQMLQLTRQLRVEQEGFC
jgi:hypothetical protein